MSIHPSFPRKCMPPLEVAPSEAWHDLRWKKIKLYAHFAHLALYALEMGAADERHSQDASSHFRLRLVILLHGSDPNAHGTESY